jgi:predicted aldo/keto reductase-like oxidoreductase
MEKTKLGRTNLIVGRTAFGALPIQRVDLGEAKLLLRKAYENGVNLFDTARAYSDSEEKIGNALHDVRQDIYIATKSMAKDSRSFIKDLETSLMNLKTDYIDIIQLHNPEILPDPKDPDSLYSSMLKAKEKGMVRFIGITNHKLSNAISVAESGLYDTVQFPLSSLSSNEDLKLIEVCRKNNVGLIAMKALSGGLITNASASFAFLRQFGNVVPIWGIQRECELDEFLELEKSPPALDVSMLEIIRRDKKELGGAFCRGCGYCLPCPAQIPIPMAARMSLLLRRAPYRDFLTDEWRGNMERIQDCTDCNNCKDHCPYGLDTPSLLKTMLDDYQKFYEEHRYDS